MPNTIRSDVLPDWFSRVEASVIEAIGAGALEGDPLRRWGSSEVWRIRSASGRSVIVKRGMHEMVREADVYAELVQPLELPAPEILDLHRDENSALLVMRDVGAVTLEQNPSVAGYRQAAQLLARIHASATEGLARGVPVRPDLRRRPDAFIDMIPVIETGLSRIRPDLSRPLGPVAELMSAQLALLRARVPDTVVHGDVEAKNLVLGANGLTLVDWPTAQVSRHLGDLYSLARAAGELSIDRSDVLDWYSGGPVESRSSLSWQVDVGGMCWTLEALRWILQEGVVTVPASIGWLDGIVADLDLLTTSLRSGGGSR